MTDHNYKKFYLKNIDDTYILGSMNSKYLLTFGLPKYETEQKSLSEDKKVYLGLRR